LKLKSKMDHFLEIKKALLAAELDDGEASAVAKTLVDQGYSTMARIKRLNRDALKDMGITRAFDVQAVLNLAQSGLSSSLAKPSALKKEHRVFISHVKLETGDVAGSIQESLIAKFGTGKSSVFLDAQEGFALDKLRERVEASSVILVLLSKGYLTRPYCLTEIVTAHKAGLHLISVNVANVAFDFSSPLSIHRNDISFIQGLFNDDGWKILSRQGYNVEDVQSAIQWCLNFKGFEYHPLSPLEVREAERTLVFDKVRELLLSDEEIAFPFQLEEFQRQKNMRELVQLWRANASNLKHGTMICRMMCEWTDKDDALPVAFASAGGGEVLVSALKSAVAAKDAEFVANGCELIKLLCDTKKDNRLETRNQLGHLGGCEAVIAALKAFGTSDKDVAHQGCAAVRCLGFDIADNRKQMGRLGGCKAVVAALKAFGTSDKDVAYQGCAAVRNLAFNNDDNKKQFGRLGGCEAVVAALKAFGTSDKDVACCGCRATTCMMVLPFFLKIVMASWKGQIGILLEST